MSQIRCLLIDDDRNSRMVIRNILSGEFPALDLTLEASSLEDALAVNEAHKPELVFLDINLGDGSGFEFLELARHKAFKLIFITGLNDFAIQAFRVNAVDYLLKPINKTELITAVNKALNFPYYSDLQSGLKMLAECMNGETNRLALPSKTGFDFFNILNLIRCESEGNYTWFYFKNEPPYLVARTLKAYEDTLLKKGFCRIHASHLINLRELKTYHKGLGGYVIMSDGTKLEVSKSKRDAFLAKLNMQLNLPLNGV